jgi:hypothetical protein
MIIKDFNINNNISNFTYKKCTKLGSHFNFMYIILIIMLYLTLIKLYLSKYLL